MIRVSVMYPKTEGASFDMEYYKTTHYEIVDRTMKPTRWEIDSGINGPYEAVGHLFYDSMEAMQAGMGDAAEALADGPNYTTIEAVVQISNIVESEA